MAAAFMDAMGLNTAAGSGSSDEQINQASSYFSASSYSVWGGDTDLFAEGTAEDTKAWLESVDNLQRCLRGNQ